MENINDSGLNEVPKTNKLVIDEANFKLSEPTTKCPVCIHHTKNNSIIFPYISDNEVPKLCDEHKIEYYERSFKDYKAQLNTLEIERNLLISLVTKIYG
jgi:hypothetical protein